MSQFQKGVFDKLQQNANISPDEVYKVADAVKTADFSDERTVRNLVRHLSRLANKRISREKEDQIVASITKKNMPKDMNALNNLFK